MVPDRDLLGVLFALVLTPLSTFAQSAQELRPTWRELVGCYRVGASRIALDSMPAAPPLLTPPPGARQAWSYWNDGASAYWRTLPNDSIELVVGNSLHGWRFVGVARGSGLLGMTTHWTDIAGVRPRGVRRVFERESCAPDGSPDAAPPNARALLDSVPSPVVAFVRDSVLPKLSGRLPIEASYVGNPYSFSARVAQELALPALRPEVVYSTSIHVEDFTLERDRFTVAVVTTTCEEKPGRNFATSRSFPEFVRVGSRWVFHGIVATDEASGVCGANLGSLPPN